MRTQVLSDADPVYNSGCDKEMQTLDQGFNVTSNKMNTDFTLPKSKNSNFFVTLHKIV